MLLDVNGETTYSSSGLADKPNHRKYMSSLVSKKQKTNDNPATAADATIQKTESQSKMPCPPRLHGPKAVSKRTKTLAERKQSQQPVESDETPDLGDCEMETDPTVGEQLEDDQERHSDQESIKVIGKRSVSFFFFFLK